MDLFKKLTIPYHLTHWSTNLLAAIPQIIGGFILVFFWVPQHIGLPWSTNGLDFFEIAPDFVEIINSFGGSFSSFATLFAYAFALIELLAGITLILGFCIRLFAFVLLVEILIIVIFREFDGTWSYAPYFSYVSICLMAIWFGSGRFGIDYLIAKRMDWI